MKAERSKASGIEERARERRRRIQVNRARSFEEAERWDLEFWQAQTPAARLAAFFTIRADILKTRPERLEE